MPNRSAPSGRLPGDVSEGATKEPIGTVGVDDRSADTRRRVQMVFQNPDATLNPSHTIEFALSRPLRKQRGLSRSEARTEVARLMERVRLPLDLLAASRTNFLADSANASRSRVRLPASPT